MSEPSLQDDVLGAPAEGGGLGDLPGRIPGGGRKQPATLGRHGAPC
ncbi:hypothetical protein [Streptomyces sp. XY332]|nr:hypothetical protein [Streptomyces sp. XY332]